MIKKLLVGYDGSAESANALDFALNMAKTYHAEVHAVFCIRIGEIPNEVGTEVAVEELKGEHRNIFKEPHQKAKDAGIHLTTVVLYGHPEYQILYEAEKVKADTIIIGHRAKSQWTRWVTGSTTQRILDLAQCNVIVVKQDYHSK